MNDVSLSQQNPLARLPPWLQVALFSLVYFAARSVYFDYPLILDARYNYNFFVVVPQEWPFDILSYSGNHNGQLWFLLAGLPNYIFPHNVYAYNVWIAVLSTTSVAAFYGIVGELSGDVLNRAELLLITALFAFHPAVFANQLHANTDTGLLIFWTWVLLALLKDKTLLAAVAGCFLLFTKEPALVHLPILFTFCALRQPQGQRLTWLKRHSMVVWLPFILMGLFLLYKSEFRHQALFYREFLQQKSSLIRVYPDDTLINYILMAFVLDFNWVVTVLGIFLTVQLARMPRLRGKQALAMAWLLLATLCVVLGVRHFSNVRYLLPLFAAMLICLAYALPVFASKRVRVSVLAALLAAFGAQNFRSIDPASNAVFCTTQFGAHRVLYIPDFDKVCKFGEDYPRFRGDPMVYNLEFLHIPLLIAAVMKDVKPDKDTAFMIAEGYNYEVFLGLDARYQFTDRDIKIKPKMIEVMTFSKLHKPHFLEFLPDSAYYLEFPTEYASLLLEYLFSRYSGTEEKTYDIDGYQLKVLKLWHKNRGEWCEPA